MRQVPSTTNPSYAILGGGRLSRHLQHYFRSLNLDFQVWTRASELPLSIFSGSEIFLLAVSDVAIEPLATELQTLFPGARCVHFSGALSSTLAEAWHPLMTFGPELYAGDFYQSIFFVGESGRSFSQVFPTLKNPHTTIDPQGKPLYHALCVMAGNFSQLLWAKAAADFRDKLGIPAVALRPYLQASLDNFFNNGATERALTGPLVRRDYPTLGKHLLALKGDPFLATYRSFLSTYGGQHEDFRFSEIQT